MSGLGFQPRKGVSPWLPVGLLFWVILMLTIFVAFYLAGGQGLGLSFGDALIYVLFRMLAIVLIFSPLFLAAFTIWLGYRFLIKKKLKTVTNQVPQPGIPSDG